MLYLFFATVLLSHLNISLGQFGNGSDCIAEDCDSAVSLLQTAVLLTPTQPITVHVNMSQLIPQLIPASTSTEGGHSIEFINAFLLKAVGFVLICGALGFMVGMSIPASCWSEDRPPLWAMGLLLSSYLLLIPGIGGTLFSLSMSINALGSKIMLTKDIHGNDGAITDSMLVLAKQMLADGAIPGACLVMLYAVVTPVLKMGLLFLGERWRHSTDVHLAQRCILIVQFISKWACPDMFAYIMLLYLLRHLDGKLPIVDFRAPAHLDIGFSCFAVFCVFSTISALAFKVPKEKGIEDSDQNGKHSSGRAYSFSLAAIPTACTFFMAFFIGISQPCIGLRINTEAFIEPNGPIPDMFRSMVDAAGIAEKLNADVSLYQCSRQIFAWAQNENEYNCIVACVMLVVFALSSTVLNVVTLLVAALSMLKGKGGAGDLALRLSRVLGHLSMLDVCIAGLIVVRLGASTFRSQGIEILLLPGVTTLLFAEALHYAASYMLKLAVQ